MEKVDIINVDVPKENMTGTNKKVMNIRDFRLASPEGKSSSILSASKEDSTQSQKTPSFYQPSSYSKNNMGPEGSFINYGSTPPFVRKTQRSNNLVIEEPDCVTPVMMTISSTLEEQVAALTKTLEGITKYIQGQDDKISKLMEKVECKTEETSKAPLIPEVSESSNKISSKEANIQISSERLIPIDQLKQFIEGTIKSKYEDPKTSHAYVKPYTRRIDLMTMLNGYQPPKLQQFDGNGNPKQHVAHFVETCNNPGTNGDYLVKQFVRSLKGNAFDWFTELEPGSIDSWTQLEDKFHNLFYSTRRTVSMIELTNAK
ncbi:hypothetical protein LIER_16506 [Lithospermum erythrorhizon]|uniref:Retrotransposon gag domain-containing protein n=1 Tax=Lithospermum erythrorhizon TaxID=34254 RepID=A0AAV3Q9E5_LITER